MGNKKNVGITTGVVVGFVLALLVNIIFIPIAIGIGGLFDIVKNKNRE